MEMQIHADSKGKVALDESHYGPGVGLVTVLSKYAGLATQCP